MQGSRTPTIAAVCRFCDVDCKGHLNLDSSERNALGGEGRLKLELSSITPVESPRVAEGSKASRDGRLLGTALGWCSSSAASKTRNALSSNMSEPISLQRLASVSP